MVVIVVPGRTIFIRRAFLLVRVLLTVLVVITNASPFVRVLLIRANVPAFVVDCALLVCYSCSSCSGCDCCSY